MFLLGILSLAQIILIPGFILSKLFKIKTSGFIQSWLYWMGLSLYSNYLAVCIFTWLKIYIPPVIFSLCFLELICLVYLFIGNKYIIPSGKTIKEYYLIFKNYTSQLYSLHRIVFIFSCFVILFFVSLIPFNIGTSYYFIDALNHWTRWPVRWASNSFPPDAGHYPQLFPANLSLIYVLTGEMGNQFFPKAVMPLFFIGNLLMFFDLALLKKSLVKLTGLIIYALILLIFYSVLFILEVNADIPVSFFGFLTFYTIIKNEHKGFDLKTILLVTVFASSAALTKLAGSYILALELLWVIYLCYKYRNSISRALIIKTGIYLLLLLFGSIFWYLVRPAYMIKGLNQSIYLVPDYTARFMNAAKMIEFTLGIPFLLFMAITLAASLFNKNSKYIAILIIFPALILWAFFFSTDYRNLSFSIPFIALASAYGVSVIYNKLAVNRKVEITHTLLIPLFGNKIFISLFIVFVLLIVFLISGSNNFFNICMKAAVILHSRMFGSYRLGYYNEIGYYKYVEYLISALRLSCILLLIMFIIKNTSIKISYIIFFAIIAAMLSGFIYFNKENILQIQLHDQELVKIHNVYFKIYPFVNIPDKNNFIITNDISYSKLIPPANSQIVYYKEFSRDLIKKQNQQNTVNYLLLAKENLNIESKEYIESLIDAKKLILCFEDEDYEFLEINIADELTILNLPCSEPPILHHCGRI